MPQIVEPIRGASEPAPNPIRWTRAQCNAIREAGVLTGRYELIDGQIITKMGQKPPHPAVISVLLGWLVDTFGVLFVRVQSTIEVGAADPEHNEPEPDLAVTRQPASAYWARHPGPGDLLLVVEVSDSTLGFDRTTKARLYARAGIEEYWIVDVRGRRLLVHRRPDGDGYGEIIAYREDESAATLVRPDAAVRVADLLPPRA